MLRYIVTRIVGRGGCCHSGPEIKLDSRLISNSGALDGAVSHCRQLRQAAGLPDGFAVLAVAGQGHKLRQAL